MPETRDSLLRRRERDGFEVVRIDGGEVVHFVLCDFSERFRDRALAGLLTNMDTGTYFVSDTRDA